MQEAYTPAPLQIPVNAKPFQSIRSGGYSLVPRNEAHGRYSFGEARIAMQQ